MRRALRLLGLVMIVGGVGMLAWAITVWQWQDPFTALYTKWQQGKLAAQLDRRMRDWQPTPIAAPAPGVRVAVPHASGRAAPATGVRVAVPHVSGRATTPTKPASRPAEARTAPAEPLAALRAERSALAADGERYRKSLHEGDALGRITVPRLGLHGMVVVNGTDHDSLTKGPGRYLGSYMPGEGKLIYIAGHRTTYLAPFAHIDSLRRGDSVTLELPYGRFVYAVTRTRVVSANDLSVLRSPNHEELILQACHPRFFATHRYLAYARLVRVEPLRGPAYSVDGQRLALATRD